VTAPPPTADELDALVARTSLLIATPSHDSRIHTQGVAGMLELAQLMGDAVSFVSHNGFLPLTRDVMTSWFLASRATHLLFLDSDIGFRAGHVLELLRAERELVSGVYVKKTPDRQLASARPVGPRDHELVEVSGAPGGFLLISRACVEQMVLGYPELRYGANYGLWLPRTTPDGLYESEDIAFCSRYRAIGGRVWLHTGVVVDHFGEFRYTPRSIETELRRQVEG